MREHSVWNVMTVAAIVVALGICGPAWASTIPMDDLQIWVDGSNIDGQNNATLSDGSYIDTWVNLSATGIGDFTQASSELQPVLQTNVINGQSVVRFDGSNRLLNPTTIGNHESGSRQFIFMVVNSDNETTGTALATRGSGPGNGFELRYHPDSSQVQYAATGGGSLSIANPGSTFNIIAISRGDGGSTHALNMQANGFDNPLFSYIAPMLNDSTAGTALGDRPQGLSPLIGDIAELIVYNRSLTEEEINSVGYYLAEKYDIETTFIPEPMTMWLLMAGSYGALLRRKR